ncbi:MAG: UvrD-helicase domain-containing protein [Ignavibacteriae bacterium]|nr:UvrD-helicase domain-containing protein [Ignavibacteriota bacterium]
MSILTEYQQNALAYNKHISLTANAGSGKTTVLAKRFVEILINEKVSLNNIVAITFTKKASSELYSKIAKELDAQIEASEHSKRYKLELLRRNLVSAKISTIHSFCIDILKDYAPEAGIDASFSPIEGNLSDELLELSIEEIINKRIRDKETEVGLKYLVRIFGTKSALTLQVKKLFGKRKTTQKIIEEIYSKDEKEISKFYHNKFITDFELIFKDRIEELILNVTKLNSIVEDEKPTKASIDINMHLNELNSKTDLIQRYQYLQEIKKSILTGKGTVRIAGYSKNVKDDNEDLIEKINEDFSKVSQIQIEENFEQRNDELAKFSKILIKFYSEILKRYTSKKTQMAYLDFEDLLLHTQRILSNEEIQNSLSEKYKYIMVDEYQDTNEIQFNIFMPILKYLSTGNLFVVGDEKQSIYMFREAEVEIFRRTSKQIQDVGSQKSILELPHSFRLAPAIALFTNILFSKLLQNVNQRFNEVAYSNLVCAYTGEAKGNIEFLIADVETETESELTAKRIIQIVNDTSHNYDFGDVAILCRKRKNFTELEATFSKYKIPHYIVGGKGFFQQQLIYDIYNYLSFLVNPNDDLALANILRAPYYSLSDVELTEISLAPGDTYFEKFQNFVKENKTFNKYLEHLESHIAISLKTEINSLIRKINIETGYWSYLAGKKNAEQEIANLKKTIQKAIGNVAQGYHSLYDFILYLKEAIKGSDDEGHAELSSEENAVKIMTIHKAKGLEFKVVVLYNTNSTGISDNAISKSLEVDKEFGILAKLPLKNNFYEDYSQAPIVGLRNYIQKKKKTAESKRELYVAITRAEEHLIISMAVKENKDKIKKLVNDSFASLIVDSLEIDLDEEQKIFSDQLTYMKLKNGKYENEMKEETITAKIISSIDDIEIDNDEIKDGNDNYEFLIDEISSYEKNEIISASKISLFLQCPKKYELTYELGYYEIVKLYKDVSSSDEFNNKEEDANIGANIGGKIVHAILEKDTEQNELESQTERLLKFETELQYLDEEKKNNFKEELLKLLNNYYSSEIYDEFKKYSNYENEFEIYIKENDYYLYGIIDKLIILDDKIIIVDYKTDKVNPKNIASKSEVYFNQLLFYSYLLRDKFPNAKTFELRLIYIRDVETKSVKIVQRSEVKNFGKVIKDSVYKIRIKEFNKDKSNCKNCQMYLLDECEE